MRCKPHFQMMKQPFLDEEESIQRLSETLSKARFERYIRASNGNRLKAIELYRWNAQLSQSLHPKLHVWEIAFRNKMNSFLCWKFGPNWPFDAKIALRQLTEHDRGSVQKALKRQRKRRVPSAVTTDAIVSDLSAGFWVALLNEDYGVPFSWRYNLVRVFPREPDLQPVTARLICNDLLDLRNRVAHHEPIYHLPLPQRKNELDRLLAAMCPAAFAFADSVCSFDLAWGNKPA